MAWIPFDFRQNLSVRILRISWRIKKNGVDVIEECDYYIGRFPPIYDPILIDTFIKGFVEAQKEELQIECLSFESAVFRSVEWYNDHPHVVVIGAKWFINKIRDVIEEMDRDNRIVSPFVLDNVINEKNGKERVLRELTEFLSLRHKRDAIIRSLHVLQSIIQPIISAGTGAIDNVKQIEEKIQELFCTQSMTAVANNGNFDHQRETNE